ncbi:uncharacterized membrane protein YoaK (UPF0700 family) [Chryseobacterium defluvii]|uniref:Uncharacterized membrane protein YoaK (UPF0700 family) n=1 Tax=Chryseobacterium defluvii TaxID=160396 RepID=A0A840K8W7_9FLAO|nr:YoaK family protein [Chryseobacterium defluvii]MBB4805666.1 uncharacterized membrane protein YoaK (UPF0700 family) [Chryseobacterium defluvii]
MFRHKGKTRTYYHNLHIACLLSFVAGIVNVAGYLSVQTLTTNVTGHFAFFIDEIFSLRFWKGSIYFFYILFFFMGSFISNFITEIISRKNSQYIYVIPTLMESIILLSTGIWGSYFIKYNPVLLSFLLLFAMGMQNSLVTTISNASVRTTHLTGLFTDLGIELSQLFFYKEEKRKRLLSSIRLRVSIISFFFLGGITGGVLYGSIALAILILAGIILLLGLIYDYIKIGYLVYKKHHH